MDVIDNTHKRQEEITMDSLLYSEHWYTYFENSELHFAETIGSKITVTLNQMAKKYHLNKFSFSCTFVLHTECI